MDTQDKDSTLPKAIENGPAKSGGTLAAPAAKPVPKKPARDYRAIVEAWLAQHVHGGPIARATPLYNALRAALEHLIRKLEE